MRSGVDEIDIDEMNSGVLNSVNSYKYIGGKKRYYMFGPKFNTRTEALYESIVP